MPKAVEVLGIKTLEDYGLYELTLPGLMPKLKASQGTEYIIDPLMYALEQFTKDHIVKRFHHTTELGERDPSQTTLEWWERFCFGIMDLERRMGWGT